MPQGEYVKINGEMYNDRGYKICGHLNQHSKPCQRIGKCPFHWKLKEVKAEEEGTTSAAINGTAITQGAVDGESTTSDSTESGTITVIKREDAMSPPLSQPLPPIPMKTPVKRGPYKQGWSKDEHLLFLKGLKQHGKGAWKEISMIVGTRTPTQIQSHAQKYFLRQKQKVKNKRSIHDITIDDLNGGGGNASVEIQEEDDSDGESSDDESNSAAARGSSTKRPKQQAMMPESVGAANTDPSPPPPPLSTMNATGAGDMPTILNPSIGTMGPPLVPPHYVQPSPIMPMDHHRISSQIAMSHLSPEALQTAHADFQKMINLFPNIHPNVLAQLIAMNSLNASMVQQQQQLQQQQQQQSSSSSAPQTDESTSKTQL